MDKYVDNFLSTGNFIGNEVWNMGKKKSRNRSMNKSAAVAEKKPAPQVRKLSVDEEPLL